VAIEVLLRIALGLRFLSSGASNVRRWPHAVGTARSVFPKGTMFFAFIGVAFMVLGGIGVAAGFQTRIAAVMIAIFLIPTFGIQRHHLRARPKILQRILSALPENGPRDELRRLGRDAIHAAETAWQANVIFLLVALFFAVRGSIAFGIDNLFG
ncbi:MAG: DoxX family protein, partial [Candidatus Binatia bacterium]